MTKTTKEITFLPRTKENEFIKWYSQDEVDEMMIHERNDMIDYCNENHKRELVQLKKELKDIRYLDRISDT